MSGVVPGLPDWVGGRVRGAGAGWSNDQWSNGQSKSPSLCGIGTGDNRPAVPPYLPGGCAGCYGQRGAKPDRSSRILSYPVVGNGGRARPGLTGRRNQGAALGRQLRRDFGRVRRACLHRVRLAVAPGLPLTRLHHSFSDGSLALPAGVRQSGQDTGSRSFQSHSSGLAPLPAATGAAAVRGCGRASGGRGERPGRSRFPHRAIRSGCGWRCSGCCRIPR